jgi:hypothetical protein
MDENDLSVAPDLRSKIDFLNNEKWFQNRFEYLEKQLSKFRVFLSDLEKQNCLLFEENQKLKNEISLLRRIEPMSGLSNLPPGVEDYMIPGNRPENAEEETLYEKIHNEIERCEYRIKAVCNESTKFMYINRRDALQWVITQMTLEDVL